jgi:lipopolysaccharide transport system ATP-binding protein
VSETVIKVENLGKKYVLSHQQEGQNYKALRDAIADGAKSLGKKFLKPYGTKIDDPTHEEFWALKDVSFEIKQGDRVGIIGRNGAGKSTLLKILSRITEPTQGSIKIKGRIASLLEVGTGFHPELTGRENIFLNGAILGMGKAEIQKKFDEIVDFAEVEKFLDTPVKRYSSGMYVRLAFAVAAHLEPELLIVDEVLAVGDAQFQKKCIGKMKEVGTEGKTVLFVSHNMATIRTLCKTGIFLQNGYIDLNGEIEKVVEQYLSVDSEVTQKSTIEFSQPINSLLWLESVTLLCNHKPGVHLTTGDSLTLQVSYQALRPLQDPKVGFVIYSMEGQALLNANNHYQSNTKSLLEPTLRGSMICELGQVPLMEGIYSISLWLGDSIQNFHHIENVLTFEVMNRDIWGTAKTPPKVSSFWWPTRFIIEKLEECHHTRNRSF